jgi:hypothetical protein
VYAVDNVVFPSEGKDMLSQAGQTQENKQLTASVRCLSVVVVSAHSLLKDGMIRGMSEIPAASLGDSSCGPQVRPVYQPGSSKGPFRFGWSL